METFFEKKDAVRMGKIFLFLGLMLALLVTVMFVRQLNDLNTPTDIAAASTIDVSGTGEAFAIPDIATQSFTVEQKAATVAEAQMTVTKKVEAALDFLKSSGVAKKDIQATNYSAYPEYTYPEPCRLQYCPASATAPKITGYTVSETITVKVRDTAKIGAIIDGLGKVGVTGLSGPNFSVDDKDAILAEAREQAIEDAEDKAKVLAKELGVRLVRVVRFSENGGGYPAPMYASKDAVMSQAGSAPELPVGENKYTSNVTITYEIR